jgi:predicted O-methyltransferase YrrM
MQVLKDVREETAKMNGSHMQVTPDQGQLLSLLVKILGAKTAVEVGVYTGYSSLAIAMVGFRYANSLWVL